ncbi:MAG: DUF1361 domain-containing protein [Candidatus Levybacteria bacterium]|nr:DUF1361 domain-containing protein [Candidatus Levybacteria bacterium]
MEDIIVFNIRWMLLNVTLALIPLVFGGLMVKAKRIYIKSLFFVIWFAFVPNTIYVVTDIIHIPQQWNQTIPIERPLLLFQYLMLEIIGLLSFISAVYLFEKLLFTLGRKKKKNKFLISHVIFVFNFIIGFGVVLGRIQKLNSWEIFSDAEKTLSKSFEVLSSLELILLVIFFGLLGNFLYFFFKKNVVIVFKKYIK